MYYYVPTIYTHHNTSAVTLMWFQYAPVKSVWAEQSGKLDMKATDRYQLSL